MKSPPLTVKFDGGSWPLSPYMTVAAGTVDQAGLGFRPFARSMREPGVFHLLAIHGSPTSVFFDLPSIWFGQGMRAKSAHEASAASAELISDGRSFGYSIDGDLEEAPGSVQLALGPTVEVLRI